MKKALTWIIAIFIFVIMAYSALWIYSYDWMTKEIDKAYAEAPNKGYEFLGAKPVLTGFPFVPEIFYGGGFKTGNTIVLFPEARLRGYPIPGLTFTLDIPRGISIDGIVDPSLWSLDTVMAKIVIPSTIPGDYSAETLSAWQKSGGKFDIREYNLTKGALQSEGKGTLALDALLQPDISFESKLRGYESFIQTLQDQNAIQPLPAAAANGILGSLSKPDEVTGENVVSLTISVQNQMVSVGPLQVVRLPQIVWGTRIQPAPLQ